MPDAVAGAAPARTRKITTTTEVTADAEEKGLGMPWQDYFETATQDQLDITTVYFYRRESTANGFIFRSGGGGEPCERIDEQWIFDHFGGGTYDLAIKSKAGRGAYIQGLKIAGAPKLTDREKPSTPPPAVAATPSAGNDPSLNRIVDLLEKTIERLNEQRNPAPAQNTPAQDATVEILTSAAKKAVEIAGSGGAAAPAANTIGDQLTLVKQLLEIARPAPPVEDEFTRAIKAATLKRLTDPMPAGAGGGLVEQLGALQKVAEMMGWNKGTGKMGWMELAALAVEKGPEIIAKASEISAHGAQIAQENRVRTQVAAAAAADFQRGGPAPAVAGPRPAAPEAPVHTIAKPAPQPGSGGIRMAPLDGPPPASAGAAPMAPAEITDPPAPGMDTKSPAFLDFVKRRVVEMVRDETDGAGIVDFLVGCQQQDMVALLESSSPEQITQFLQRDPILQWAVKDPGWQRTLAEVKKYLREEGPQVQ